MMSPRGYFSNFHTVSLRGNFEIGRID